MDEVREALFPLSGIDVSCEVDRQTPRTTARGVNVRACDPRTLRVRGAARPGLSKLLGDTVSGLAGYPVQHLNVIVDPTVDALLASDSAAMSPPGAIPDPSTNNAAGGDTDPSNPLVRNPGRTIRNGGSGIQPNRHVPVAPPQTVFVQKHGELIGNLSGTYTATLDAQPNIGDLIVVFARTYLAGVSTPRVSGVKDGAGNPYDNVGGAGYYAETTSTFGGGTAHSASMWWKVAASGTEQTVKITTGGLTNVEYAIAVYRGLASLGPAYDKVKTEDPTLVSTHGFTGLLFNGTVGELVVAGFGPCFSGAGTIVTANYNARFGLGSTGSNLYLMDRLNGSGVGPEAASVNRTSGTTEYVCVAASFHR